MAHRIDNPKDKPEGKLITGVILAGGQGRRMQGADKGLVVLGESEMVAWVIDILRPGVEEIIVNANRNLALYEKFGVRVVSDSLQGISGSTGRI